MELSELIDGPCAPLREETRQRVSSLGLEKADGLDRDDYRDLVMTWVREVGASGDGARSFPVEYGGQDDPGGRIATFQTTAHGDVSLLVNAGIEQGEAPSYPSVVGLTWDFQEAKQSTTLQLADRRLEPQRA